MAKVVAIAGGVGGAKLALGLARILAPGELTVVVNTGDDETFHGLHVSPDVDTVTYALAGIANRETGWGVEGDSFRALHALGRLGGETWFLLGDVDLGLHLRRTELLASGRTLSEATEAIAQGLGARQRVVPMSDDRVRTVAVTDEGEMAFQEYFVRRGCEPRLRGARFDGAESARMSPGFRRAVAEADSIVVCPSNPVVSIGPVLAVPGVREAIGRSRAPRVAVSPLVGGAAVKGPAAKMMGELGEAASNAGVARRYAGIVDALVIDERDASDAPAVEECGVAARLAQTVMRSEADKEALAERVLFFADELRERGRGGRGV